jgi:hypothetical protein
VGGRPFSFIHFLAVYTAWKVNCPELIYFHHTELPTGIWWDKARPLLKLSQVDPVHEVYGRPVKYKAHMADVIRLAMLERHGGIYLDLDVISLNPLDPLLENDFVMGIEPGTGLCNAVILTRPGSTFLMRWRSQYRSFDSERWNFHSVVLPWELARSYPSDIHVADKYAFFYPTHNDPVSEYLWGGHPRLHTRALRLSKNALKLALNFARGQRDAVQRAQDATFHALFGGRWHYRRAARSYVIHLWEGLWGERYLKQVTPEYLRHSESNFASLLRGILSDHELQDMGRVACNSVGD